MRLFSIFPDLFSSDYKMRETTETVPETDGRVEDVEGGEKEDESGEDGLKEVSSNENVESEELYTEAETRQQDLNHKRNIKSLFIPQSVLILRLDGRYNDLKTHFNKNKVHFQNTVKQFCILDNAEKE